jgi:hypothetical protein
LDGGHRALSFVPRGNGVCRELGVNSVGLVIVGGSSKVLKTASNEECLRPGDKIEQSSGLVKGNGRVLRKVFLSRIDLNDFSASFQAGED